MSTSDNKNKYSNNINSNKISDKESSFNFKGFPYVISVLGEDYTQSEDEKLKGKIKKKIEDYLTQVADVCSNRSFWSKKFIVPFVILFDLDNQFITETVEDFQREYLNKNKKYKIKNHDIVLVALVGNNLNNYGYKNIEEYNRQVNQTSEVSPAKYFWSYDWKSDSQGSQEPDSPSSIRRRKNEILTQRSHLTIVFSDPLEQDVFNAPEDSLSVAIRYKLEGYPGSRYQQKQTEKITYHAIGPVLHIVIKNDSKLETYYYPSREPITKQVDNNPRIINQDYLKNCLIDDNFNFTLNQEINGNLEIIKEINKSCLKNNNESAGELFIEELSKGKQRTNNKPHKHVQQLIAYSKELQGISDHYEWWTNFITKSFCSLFLLVLAFNAALIYLNDICIIRLGANIFQIFRWKYPLLNSLSERFVDFGRLLHLKLDIDNIAYLNIPDLLFNHLNNVSNDLSTLIFSSLLIIFSLIFGITLIIIVYFISRILLPHRKFHMFQTLADCLRIQAYWKYAGMSDNVSANFRSHQIPKIDWLLIAFNGLNIITIDDEKEEKEEYSDEKIALLDKIWLEDRIINEFEKVYTIHPLKEVWNSLQNVRALICCYALIVLLVLFRCFIFPYYIISSIAIAAVALIWFVFKPSEFVWKVIAISGVLYGCLAGFFELHRLSLLCYEAQTAYSNAPESGIFPEVFRLEVQLVLAFVIVALLYTKMQMFDKERRRIEQLRSSFNVADYSLDVVLNETRAVDSIAAERIKYIQEIANDTLKSLFNEDCVLIDNYDVNISKDIKAIGNLLDNHDICEKIEQNPIKTETNKSWWFISACGRYFKNLGSAVLGIGNKNSNQPNPIVKTEEIKKGIHQLLSILQNRLNELVQSKNEQLFQIIEKARIKNLEKKQNNNSLENNTQDENSLKNQEIKKEKKKFCQQILLELGQEVLTKRINWLLDVNDRDLKKPQ